MFYNHVQLERERDMPGEFFLGWNPLVSKIVFGLECFLAFTAQQQNGLLLFGKYVGIETLFYC